MTRQLYSVMISGVVCYAGKTFEEAYTIALALGACAEVVAE